jgi:hypothetical protein
MSENNTPLANLRDQLLTVLPHVDIIEGESGELTILTRLTLDKDDLVPLELTHNQTLLRDLLTESLLPPYVEPAVSYEDEELPELDWSGQ